MSTAYTVNDGDCIGSIASSHGLTWRTLWDHPDNQQLKETRKDPNILYPGDIVHIPNLDPRIESCSTEQRHKFKLKGVKIRLRIQLLDEDPEEQTEDTEGTDPSIFEVPDFKPETGLGKGRANVPYLLDIDGVTKTGTTDGDGFIDELIFSKARSGRIILNAGTPTEEVIPLKLGYMDPLNELEGIKKRLINLGFPGSDGDEESPDFVITLKLFQEAASLPITGQLDQATRSKLLEAHGS